MQCDKKSLLAAVDVSKRHNLMTVGRYTDNVVDLCGKDNTDAKRQFLGKGHTIPTKQPSQAEFEGQSVVNMIKETARGKRDTTLPHHHTFSSKIIPVTDKRVDEKGMSRLKSRMKKVGGTLMSDMDGNLQPIRPSLNVILGVDGSSDCDLQQISLVRTKQCNSFVIFCGR
jgi:hypothetical protein